MAEGGALEVTDAYAWRTGYRGSLSIRLCSQGPDAVVQIERSLGLSDEVPSEKIATASIRCC